MLIVRLVRFYFMYSLLCELDIIIFVNQRVDVILRKKIPNDIVLDMYVWNNERRGFPWNWKEHGGGLREDGARDPGRWAMGPPGKITWVSPGKTALQVWKQHLFSQGRKTVNADKSSISLKCTPASFLRTPETLFTKFTPQLTICTTGQIG